MGFLVGESDDGGIFLRKVALDQLAIQFGQPAERGRDTREYMRREKE